MRKATVWQGDSKALSDVSLQLFLGESTAVLGPNGAGKSTFLKVLTGELRPARTEGMECRLFGEKYWDLEDLRERIGVLMPEEVSRFHPQEKAFDVVISSLQGAYGCTRQMVFTQEEKEVAEQIIDSLGLSPYLQKGFGELSSGEKRRFLIARALVHQPEVLVLDEPSTALDFASTIRLNESLRKLAQAGRSLVWVTHHPGEITPEVERVILLKEGMVFRDGPPREVLESNVLSELYEVKLKVGWSEGWCQVTAG